MTSPMLNFLMNPSGMRGETIGQDRLKDKNIFIDTCFANDTGKFETYIEKNGEGVIVEIYPGKEEAIKGHKKWRKLVKKNPNIKLKSVMDPLEWALGI